MQLYQLPCSACSLPQDGELALAAESLSAKEEALQALQADHAALNTKATAFSVRRRSCLMSAHAVVTDILARTCLSPVLW